MQVSMEEMENFFDKTQKIYDNAVFVKDNVLDFFKTKNPLELPKLTSGGIKTLIICVLLLAILAAIYAIIRFIELKKLDKKIKEEKENLIKVTDKCRILLYGENPVPPSNQNTKER